MWVYNTLSQHPISNISNTAWPNLDLFNNRWYKWHDKTFGLEAYVKLISSRDVNFNGGVGNPPLTVGYGCVIISRTTMMVIAYQSPNLS